MIRETRLIEMALEAIKSTAYTPGWVLELDGEYFEVHYQPTDTHFTIEHQPNWDKSPTLVILNKWRNEETRS